MKFQEVSDIEEINSGNLYAYPRLWVFSGMDDCDVFLRAAISDLLLWDRDMYGCARSH